jgi:hypothetical protein
MRRGLAITFGAAGEYRAYRLLACEDQNCTVPSRGLVGGGFVTVGYDDRPFGFHAGPLIWQRFANSTDASPTVAPFPEIQFRFGRLDRFYVDLGLGSYDVPTILRPGGYVGFVWAAAPGWECALHGGLHSAFDGVPGIRGSLRFKAPLSRQLQLGFTVAGTSGAYGAIEPEGQLLLVLRL